MKTYCFVRHNGQLVKLNYDKIQLVEACRNYCKMILDNNQQILLLRTMKEIESFLPSTSFIRIHKSYIIPINRIQWVCGKKVQLETGQKIPIGEVYADKVDQLVVGHLL
jgi:DNA-binding LytR/AlgR family response regulator